MTTPARSTEPTDVYLEVGTKRVFACALVWPGTGTSFAGFHFLVLAAKNIRTSCTATRRRHNGKCARPALPCDP
jgi:hypothetical protein